MLKISDHVLYIPSFTADIKIDIFIYQVPFSGMEKSTYRYFNSKTEITKSIDDQGFYWEIYYYVDYTDNKGGGMYTYTIYIFKNGCIRRVCVSAIFVASKFPKFL
jgi:hypothetical protein